MNPKNNNKVIIVSNRLPVKIERKEDGLVISPSEGGLATGLGSIYNEGNNIWVGWPGIIPQDEAETAFITEELRRLNLVPVFLTEEEILGYYEGFSNEVLWPICHYSPSYAVYDTDNWNTYVQVNEKFGQIVREYIDSEDTVWIHDYQLMLLPNVLRRQYEKLSIGYFQHIPFPPDEVFRSIPWRNELLLGILGADLIAFHTFNDTQHFLDACTHILNIPIRNNYLQIRGRSAYVEVYPMGIDFDKFNTLSKEPAVKERALEIKSYFKQRKIILSIDRLDYSKGIIQRIVAFEELLKNHPELRDQVVLYMLVVPSRDKVKQYKRLRDEIDRRVGNINSVYGSTDWTPIAYFYNSYPVEELSSLYVAADVCLITSIRDGMNLVSKEYIASKEETSGVLVLSELAGASKELIDAVHVNPNSVDQISHALHFALHMSEEEKLNRMNANFALVKKFNIHHWVEIFFARMKEIKIQQRKEFARKIQPENNDAIAAKFQSTTKRIFFLDYDGTLIGFHNEADKATPTDEVYELLDTLQSDPNNTVVIISGRPHQTLDKWFGNRGYTLVGEHGVWKKLPGEAWRSKSNLSDRWKPSVKRIMNKIANRTAGSSVEEKEYSMAWHYRKVQSGLGRLRAQELMDSLRYLIPHHGLQLLYGDKVIEVKNSEVNKGKAASGIVEKLQPDFIFAMGDDATDEDMFHELPAETVSVKVGSKKSAAKYYVDSQQDAIQLLHSIAGLIQQNQPK
ncbi:bifunctional alpha,alpha-trehalose-phosphate synthase (UDP-forming)/trehalose-phosphatase [Sphingobacterium sp. lm-10]|uniref:bifunctional alpha,alpha-trehalose-phosphate synthase (UDP-forming)/trehalose-phosphatase n=1 Tax=Sphingobacterium sp. lm-10 TaxID=2944904 RepID=UPI0020226313|nr:bifunctional alpha,alpha-trehalose-phosphate synthase (UDP-forming)/trehalose-phosphatase [Sphingobacterium sp. lm-10]MCL7987961.1 bifunctional alpha,alpha-trehalose-phosphate synthase (UDP-forming)/trehalose-phosphatase [Sphingobacterium sp. lm-10]